MEWRGCRGGWGSGGGGGIRWGRGMRGRRRGWSISEGGLGKRGEVVRVLRMAVGRVGNA